MGGFRGGPGSRLPRRRRGGRRRHHCRRLDRRSDGLALHRDWGAATTALPTAPSRLLLGNDRCFDFANGCHFWSGSDMLDEWRSRRSNLTRGRGLFDDADGQQFRRRPLGAAAAATTGAAWPHTEPWCLCA